MWERKISTVVFVARDGRLTLSVVLIPSFTNTSFFQLQVGVAMFCGFPVADDIRLSTFNDTLIEDNCLPFCSRSLFVL